MMNEAEGDYSDLLHDAMCWRELRKLMGDAALQGERPRADRLLICREALEGFRQLLADDIERDLNQRAAALSKERMPQLKLDHEAREAQRAADRATGIVTLVNTALGEGAEGRWPALFPEQKHDPWRPVDGEQATQRHYLGTLLEYADRLPFFGSLTEPANLIATAVNGLGGVGGKLVKAQKIKDWHKQVRASDEDSIGKKTYRNLLNAWLSEMEQPRKTADAVAKLRHLVTLCRQIDPRRAGRKEC
jgi:hypothetical protein